MANTIVPFSSSEEELQTEAGVPSNAIVVGFGRSEIVETFDPAVPMNSTKVIAFTMPFDGTVRSINAWAMLVGDYTPTGTMHPYVQIYTAPSDTGTFNTVADLRCEVAEFAAGTAYPATTTHGGRREASVALSAGTRVMVVAALSSENASAETAVLRFGGGMEIEPTR